MARVERSVNDFGIRRIESHISTTDASRVWSWSLQDGFPIFPAVCRFEKSAIAAIGPEMTEGSDIRYLRICGMNDDSRDLAAVLETNVLPRPPAVRRTIDAVSPTGRVAIVRLTGPYPHHIGIRGRDCNRANRLRCFLIENRLERNAVVAGFENAASREAHIEESGIARIDCDVGDAAAHHGGANGANL